MMKLRIIILVSLIVSLFTNLQSQCGFTDIGNMAFVSLSLSPPNSAPFATCRTVDIAVTWEVADQFGQNRTFNNACHGSILQIAFPTVLLGTQGNATISASDLVDYFEDIQLTDAQATVAISPGAVIPNNTQITLSITDIPMQMIDPFYFNQLVSCQVSHSIAVDQDPNDEEEDLSFSAYTPTNGFDLTLAPDCDGTEAMIDATPSGGGGFAGNPAPNYSYSWAGPNGFSSSLEDPIIDEVGTYFVTMTDSGSECVLKKSIDMDEINCLLLPVTLLDIKVSNKSCQPLLEWHTTDEINHSHYNIYRKNERSDFEMLETITSPNRGNGKYSFADHSINENGDYYYSIEQVDLDGKSTYFPTQVLSLDCFDDRSVSIYPNPFMSNLIIEKSFEDPIDVEIMNASGVVVYSEKKMNANTLALESLIAGMYHCRIINSHSGVVLISKKLVKSSQ